jgi:hypothetical protein
MTMQRLKDIETERLNQQARLDQAMGQERRNQSGQYATPGLLAEDIVNFCRKQSKKRPEPVRFLEPSIGTGSFFSALQRIYSSDFIEKAMGIEIDPEHAAISGRLWKHSGLRVQCADFTALKPPDEKFNLLITNPPYVRHHHLDPTGKKRLQAVVQERLGIRISGLAGLYCYFLLLADEWMEEGGLSVWLIPSEFMDVNYGRAIKEYLTTRVRLLHIHRYCPTDVQFADALVSSAVVVFQKAPPAGQNVIFSLGGSILSPQRSVTLFLADVKLADKWTQYPARPGNGAQEHADTIRFGDLFTIRRGLATGSNDFFILPRIEARQLELPDEWLRPILPPPRRLPGRVIDAEADGYPQLDPQLVLLDCRLPESEVRNRYPGLWRYLQEGKRRKIHESYLTSRRTPWYSQEDRPPPPFLCTYMGRNGNGRKPFRFLWNQSQATAHNVYLLLYPKGEFKAALTRNASLYQKAFSAIESLDTENITGNGRVYGGGLFKMEPKELASIPAQFILDAIAITPSKKPRQRSLFDALATGDEANAAVT